MLPPDIDRIDLKTLEEVVGTAEGLTLDFKEELPLSNRNDKKEFLTDVVAFANSSGGYILIGVSERREDSGRIGVATALPGVECNPDSTILAIESLLRDGIAPRISGLRTTAVHVMPGRYILVLRIPQSWVGPHMVTLGDSRFHGRSSRGKYALDITQIRSAFAGSESQIDRLRSFRDDRIGSVIARNTPVLLKDCPTSLTHLVPANAMSAHASVDVRQYEQYTARLAEPARMSGPQTRYNLDGFCLSQGDPVARSYVQCFRNGTIEFGDAYYLPMDRPGYETSIAAQNFEEMVLRQVHAGLDVMHLVDSPTPVYIFLSVIGVKGWMLDYWDEDAARHFTFDRDNLPLPDIALETHDDEFVPRLQPVFDAFWQSAGVARSPSYRGTVWVGRGKEW